MEQTFCFVDLAGFSALTEVHGDETGADLVERFTEMARGVLVGNGELVATIGDAIFLVFDEAPACLAFLEWLWRRTEEERNFPALRAGVHQGEAVRRGHDFYGHRGQHRRARSRVWYDTHATDRIDDIRGPVAQARQSFKRSL